MCNVKRNIVQNIVHIIVHNASCNAIERTRAVHRRPHRNQMVCANCGARDAPVSSLCGGGCCGLRFCCQSCELSYSRVNVAVCARRKAQQEAEDAIPTLIGDTSGFIAEALRDVAESGGLGEAGRGYACTDLAVCYTVGAGGVGVDLDEAFRWHRRAVEVSAPTAVAYHNLGVCYFRGQGVPRDPAEAVRLYKIAAEMGFGNAQFSLGVCLQRGVGAPVNSREAFTWLKLAADGGLAGAQCAVGHALQTGHGVEADKAAAVGYYRLAAEQGRATAMYSLGLCYRDGAGVPRNPSFAVLWLNRALDAGNVDAANEIVFLSESLSREEVPLLGAGVLRALLLGLAVDVSPTAGKQEMVELVLARSMGFMF